MSNCRCAASDPNRCAMIRRLRGSRCLCACHRRVDRQWLSASQPNEPEGAEVVRQLQQIPLRLK